MAAYEVENSPCIRKAIEKNVRRRSRSGRREARGGEDGQDTVPVEEVEEAEAMEVCGELPAGAKEDQGQPHGLLPMKEDLLWMGFGGMPKGPFRTGHGAFCVLGFCTDS